MIVGSSKPPPTTLDALLGPGLASRLDALDLLSRKVLSGKLPGERRSKRRGRSVEFDDFRDYIPGDDLRHIDWNVYARLDRLMIKLFREEEDLSLRLILDVSASMDAGEPSKLVFAARLALALAYVGLVNQNRVSLAVFGRERWPRGVRMLAPLRGRSGVQRLGRYLLDTLADVSRSGPGPGGSFAESMRAIAQARRERGITVVLSDFLFDEDPGAGLAFAAPGALTGEVDAYAIRVLAPEEPNPALATNLFGDLRLTDAETAKAAEVTVTPASIRAYTQRFEAHAASLRQNCLARGIALFTISSQASVEELVTATLRRGGLLR